MKKTPESSSFQAGFAEVDITPPVGTRKIGWIRLLVGEKILDPLFARAAILESNGVRLALISLDTLSVRWTIVADIRKRIQRRYGFPGNNIMVAATHNHAGPAIATVGEVPRDEVYTDGMIAQIVEMFGQALARRQPAKIGFDSTFEFRIAHNRRVVMRDGTAKTQYTFDNPMALCMEGPADPELAVVAVQSLDGAPLGLIANYACHPTHHGGGNEISAGYPGVFARRMKAGGWPVPLFLNGACGNTIDTDPTQGGQGKTKEEIGELLAADVTRIVAGLRFTDRVNLDCRKQTLRLPYRKVTKAEINGTVHGAQRFIDSAIYDRWMPDLLKRIRQRRAQPAEVQIFLLNQHAIAAIPAEYFVQNGLKIKEESYPWHALVVSHANGMVGYVPHREAFRRGGYETTFWGGSRLAPQAGDLLANAAIGMIHKGLQSGQTKRKGNGMKMRLGIQLYTVRDACQKDFKGTLTALAKMGYEGVEFAGDWGGMKPDELAAFLKGLKLQTAGMHVGLDGIMDPKSDVYAYAKALKSPCVTVSLPADSEAQWLETIQKVSKAAKVARSQGVIFTYHNHAHEFVKFQGKYALDLLAEKTDKKEVQFELDTFWIKTGGADPVPYIRQFPRRAPQIHLKDMDPADKTFTEVGRGLMDLPGIFKAAEEIGAQWIIVEQDTCKRPSLESARISIEGARKAGLV